jgi:hypothetical protein
MWMRDGWLAGGAVGTALLAGAVFAGGCGRVDRVAIAKPVAVVMEEVSRADYQPPADGRLNRPQVEMYLEVRERANRIREQAAEAAQAARAASGAAGEGRGAAADPGEGATADLRAVQDLHGNPKEYLWVRMRVQEAQAAAATRALLRKMSLGREQLVGRLRAERDRLADPAAKAAAERQLAALERGLAESDPEVPREVEANMRLLAGYRSRLARLQQLEERALVRAAAGVEAGPEASAGTAVVAAAAAGRSSGQ